MPGQERGSIMAQTREEIAADLVWRYVEQIRAANGPDGQEAAGRAGFTREELEELLELLETAAATAEALSDGGAPADERACRAAVRSRVEAALGVTRPARPRFRLAGLLQGGAPVPVWRFRAVACALVAAAVALGTVGIWHQPRASARPLPIPADAPDVQPLTEEQVHALLPRMVRNQLQRDEERSVMWHMLICPGCYDTYVALRRQERLARDPIRFARH